MNEYVLVEFLIEVEHLSLFGQKSRAMGSDFILNRQSFEFEAETDDLLGKWCRISGQINSAYASMIKLQDPFLSERMRISYISNELKDKYRKRDYDK